jgi:hypothetical protein
MQVASAGQNSSEGIDRPHQPECAVRNRRPRAGEATRQSGFQEQTKSGNRNRDSSRYSSILARHGGGTASRAASSPESARWILKTGAKRGSSRRSGATSHRLWINPTADRSGTRMLDVQGPPRPVRRGQSVAPVFRADGGLAARDAVSPISDALSRPATSIVRE